MRTGRRWRGAALALVCTLALGACANRIPDSGAGVVDLGAGATANSAQAGFRETVGDTVHFATDSASLSAEAKAILEAQARWLIDHPGMTATIEGHTDERGTRAYNVALGARRAQAVRDFLVARGVSPERLKTVSYGKERPVALCSAESCWAQNRRAVTVLAAPAS